MFKTTNQYFTTKLFQRFSSSKVIGIDLGTTNSAVAYIRDPNDKQSAMIIENEYGKSTTPSIVSYDNLGNILIGIPAKRQAILNPKNTFFATKRLIGRSFNDPETQNDINNMPYLIVENETNQQAYFQTTFGKRLSPSEVGSVILSYLKNMAGRYIGEDITKAVVTVPAYFNDSQRQATKDAGTMAGLDILRIINEPTAAALCCGCNSKSHGIIAVYDLGGGTFDISILDIEDDVFEVRATNGDTHLGGEDFDNVISNYIIDDFTKKNPQIDRSYFTKSPHIMQRIREAAEKAKIELSHVNSTIIDIPFAYKNKHISLTITESELNQLTKHLIERTISPVKKALSDADIKPTDVDDIILVGGMTRMPEIRSIVSKIFGKTPNTGVNPDESVALGAAIQGGVLSGEIKDVLLLDVTPLTLGIETYGGIFSPLISRNTTLPVKKTEIFSTGVDGQTGVDIKIYQGERGLVRNNKLIGDFKLTGIQPLPKGIPEIHVTFDIDANGIINVSASEKGTGKEKSITVLTNSGLTKEDIQRLVDEGNANKEHDNLIRQHVELITKMDIMISDTENVFEKFHNTIKTDKAYPQTLDAIKEIRSKINYLKTHDLDFKVDINAIKREADQVQKMSLKLFQNTSRNNETYKN